MGYYVSQMFGIRTGGVFSGEADMDDLRRRIATLVRQMRAEAEAADSELLPPDLGDADGDPSHCLSHELEAHKGSYVVLAGVFNYWIYRHSTQFARRLSEAFQTEVLHMCWNEEEDTVQCQVWLAGKPLFEVAENPIGRILRRVT